MKNKGFTLVELLAMLVVLGVLMTVTIPNIAGILGNQKKNIIKNDATTMVETAKVKVARGYVKKPKNNNECVVMSLNYLNDNDNINAGPNGGTYDEYDSFVIYKKVRVSNNNYRYDYYVRLIEKNSKYYYGIALEDIRNITESSNNVKKITGYNKIINETDSNKEEKIKNMTGSSCSSVTKYYQRES